MTLTRINDLPLPAKYDPRAWNNLGTVQAVEFDFHNHLMRLIQVNEADSTVTIKGRSAPALNLQLQSSETDGNFPVYFEVTGRTFHYVFHIWLDRVEIKVQMLSVLEKNNTSNPNIKVELPITVSELIKILCGISRDLP